MKKFIITETNVAAYVDKIGAYIKQVLKEAGKEGAVIGISGGIDCAVVATICAKYQIKTKLFSLPNNIVSTRVNDLATFLNQPIEEYNIAPIVDQYKKIINLNEKDDLINLYPRIRMSIFYLLAARYNYLVAGTSNLSEITAGYYTKWGDNGNDFLPLGNLVKSEIVIIGKYLNLPPSILNALPSADLYPGQNDESELGFTYKSLDQYILTGSSGDKLTDEKIANKVKLNYHKIVKSIFQD